MNEQTKQEITRLLLEQVAVDETREHQCLLAGSQGNIRHLLGVIMNSDYKHIHPAWAIQLYLGRN